MLMFLFVNLDWPGFRENRQSLTLLELPSIFIPEDWSFTFFEGISRHPDTGFRDRDVVELGCGNGWVSIALAERWSPRKASFLHKNSDAKIFVKFLDFCISMLFFYVELFEGRRGLIAFSMLVGSGLGIVWQILEVLTVVMWDGLQVYGLDINPRAIKVAWINLYLNALSEDGSPVLDQAGKSLLDRVEFHVSDLLAYCREQSLSLDLIVGCIPQVNLVQKPVLEQLSLWIFLRVYCESTSPELF